MITLDQFYNKYVNQSVLYNTKDPSLRGQCVQLVCFYVVEVWGLPVMWKNAAWWWYETIPGYQKVAPNDIQRGDLVVYDRSLPGSGDAGHIEIAWDAVPGRANFTSFSSNWGGKTAHLVSHGNKNYVLGGLRKVGPAPTPAPQPQGGLEMIRGRDNALKAYQMLRPNGQISEGEIAATADRRSYEEFVNTGQAEVQARNNAIRAQEAERANMQGQINTLNQTITGLNETIKNKDASTAEKQTALNDALAKIAECTTELETSHDKIGDLQKQVSNNEYTNTQAGLLTRILAFFIKPKK
jgi:hypothetical protein